MFKINFKLVGVSILLIALTVGFTVAPGIGQQEKKTIKFGVVPWSESLAVGDLIAYILEEEIGWPVEISNPAIGVAYKAMANKDLDLFVESWLYVTHEAYWEKLGTELRDFGPIYEDASLGWAVPNYIPKDVFNSVTDMDKPEVKEKSNSEIIGIDPGSGLMQHSEVMMEEYPELEGWELKDSSDYAMVAELKRRIQRKEWTVVTLWKPHFAFARFDIRYIKEPKGILGAEEEVHMMGRQDFTDVFPNEVSEFLSRFYMGIEKMNEITDLYEENEATAAPKFIANHLNLVHYWVTGEVAG